MTDTASEQSRRTEPEDVKAVPVPTRLEAPPTSTNPKTPAVPTPVGPNIPKSTRND